MSTEIVDWFRIKTKEIKEESIYLANDRENVLSEICEEEILRLINTYVLRKRFKVTKLRYNIIFDMPWLEIENK